MTRRITSQVQSVVGGSGIQSGTQSLHGFYTRPHTYITTQTVDLAAAFKPKRAGKNPKLSHVVFLLDDSSSMQSCRDITISGFNEYLASQKADANTNGISTVVSLYKFNGYDVKCVFDRQDVQTVEPLTHVTYNPSGNTNLLDAMGGVLMKVNNLLSEKKKAERESVIINVLTDGEENASRTFDNTSIKAMVEKAEGKNWGFLFLGANIDAFQAGHALGFSVSNTIQFDTKNTDATMRAASRMTNSLKGAYASGTPTSMAYAASTFTKGERAAAVGKDNE
jgi:hypothetical protein